MINLSRSILNSLRPILYSALFSCLIIPSAFAENLIQVYQHAQQHDAQLKISEAGFLASLEKKPQIMSLLKPRVDLTANTSYNLQYAGRTIRGDDGAAFLNFGYELTLRKPLINKALQAQIAQVDISILQAEANLEADRQDLIIRVAEAYFDFLNAKETVNFRKLEKNAIGRQLKQIKAFFDAGRSAITDVKEAQARYDLARAQEVIANQQIELSREKLRAITTRYYHDLNGASDKIVLLIPKPQNIEAWAKTALINSKSLIAAQHAVSIAQAVIDKERAEKNPTVDLFARHSGGSTFGEDAFDQDKLDASVGVQLKMPIYHGGDITSRVREARHNLHRAQQQLELQKRLATQQTRAAYLTIISGLSQVKALRQALNSSQTATKATQAGFEAGTRTAVDVLLSLRETFASRRDYTTARYDFLLNTLKLKQATGTLSEHDLAAISKLLTRKAVQAKPKKRAPAKKRTR